MFVCNSLNCDPGSSPGHKHCVTLHPIPEGVEVVSYNQNWR